MPKPPAHRPSSHRELSEFLRQAERLPVRSHRPSGRLIFAMDATASRQPTWDRACALHSRMFQAAQEERSPEVQLCYYRGFNEFHASPWLADDQALLHRMNAVQCLGGHTQIERLLHHCLAEHRRQPVTAVVFIGDALEESADTVCQQAGQLGLMGLPLLIFQEGSDSRVETVFRQLARLSRGAYARFDAASADTLAELLHAARVFAAEGTTGLERLDRPTARQLLKQLRQ